MSPYPPNLETQHKPFHKQIDDCVENIPALNASFCNNILLIDTLNSPIEYYELTNCIHNLDKDKAYGPDLIHNQMIINGGPTLWSKLLVLFNKCLSDGTFPTIWNFANICPIPKPSKIHSDPKNYRPIAISSCLGRLFEKILAKRLQQFCIENKIFNNNQCGFQINRSTDDILTTFLNDAYTSINNKNTMYCIFTDFSKAYDSIWHNGLIFKLYYEYNIKANFLKCIINFIRNRYTRVITKMGSSTWKIQTQGLPQGSSLSPILYILFTNDFKLKFHQFIKMGCFADDTAFWTLPSSVKFLKQELLQKELYRFTDWSKYWKMSINPTKCSYINVYNRNSDANKTKFTIDLNPYQKLPPVNILVSGLILTLL